MAFSYKDYEESELLKEKRKALEANEASAPVWNGGAYENAVTNLAAQINNRKPFQYDVNADALYQQYRDQYMNAGKLAMQDTMGQAAALTGGYANSYAQMVGQQAYNQYAGKANDVALDLYNIAYQRYKDEGDELKDRYTIAKGLYDTKYDEYRDRVGDWRNENTRLVDAYNTLYKNEYNKYADDYDRAYKAYTANNGGTVVPTSEQDIVNNIVSLNGDEQKIYDYLLGLLDAGVITEDLMDYYASQYLDLGGSTGSETFRPQKPTTNYQVAKGENGSYVAEEERKTKKKKNSSAAGGTYYQTSK